ncbi:guanylate kinase [Mycoemilia scoparia]|uniref:guanylate kinase n=1 Tax=Mycoemilia scoparia TaxID=417184 RepID=A0A9W8DX44_9FUNG|nr:guanylate kinase [Mycoemilia scoparia]
MASSLKNIIVLSGPSGAGKSTLLKRLFKDYPDTFGFSISRKCILIVRFLMDNLYKTHTTRAPRPGEQDGREYHFVSNENFEQLIKENAFIEHAKFSNNRYGTSFKAVGDVVKSNLKCILDVDMQGVKSIKNSDLKAHYVFIAPPSIKVLEERLRGRQTDSEESIQTRLKTAEAEIAYSKEPSAHDIIIINDNLEEAYKKLVNFILGDSKKETQQTTSSL